MNRFYKYLPPSIQNIGISLYGIYWQRRRFGGIFLQEYKDVQERESYSAQQWNDYQTIELRKLLLHAWDTVPFYQEKYKQAGINRSLLERFELNQLTLLPILTKDELRQFGTTTLLSTKPETGGSFYASSGSTGTPTQIMYSTRMHQRWSASFEARIRNWAGVSRFDPRGMIGGRRVLPDAQANPPFHRYNFAEKQTYFSAYHLSKHNTPHYLHALIENQVNYMIGYATSNFLLAKYIDELHLQAPQLKAVITSSEKLTSEMRSIISKVYQCEVYDAYSSVEACCSITESEHHQLLESPDVGIMEYLQPNLIDPAPLGEIGAILCTGLLNRNQPLIRYQIGDAVKLATNQTTKCGRNMTVIDEIIGRSEDVITGPDGRQMVRFHGITLGIPKIRQSQIVQYSITEYSVKLILTEPLSANERDLIISRMQSQLGNVNVNIEEVSSFPLTANGKFKAVISELKP